MYHADQQAIAIRVLQQATDSIRHRGPDDEGYLLCNTRSGQVTACAGQATDHGVNLPTLDNFQGEAFDLAFGFRRLAIQDLSPAGHQPMASPDGRYWIVFNGEIYNYVELRAELSVLGHQFRSGSDTEVILAAYAQWNKAMLNRFVGMFAFAILDRQERKLFLARDFFGIKPLYYTLGGRETGSRFAFASEIKALLALPGVARQANPQRLYDYLRFGLTDHGAETMFADICQLPAAHYLEIQLDSGRICQPVRYWSVSIDEIQTISLQAASTRLRELFLENVRLHLRSDVPVGSCLSGGIDSSAIVLAMRQLEGPKLDLHTFSAVFDDPVIGEEKYVDMAAAAAQSIVHKTAPTADELIADLDHLVYVQEEPFGSTSIYAQQRVFRLAGAAGIKVMLDGQGADEILGGYRSALSIQLAALVKSGQWTTARQMLARAAALPGVSQQGLLKAGLNLIVPPAVQAPFRYFAGKEIPPLWLNQAWFSAKGVSFARPAHTEYAGPQLLHQYLQRATTQTSLPMLLRYEDRNSMSHSIESRVPFLTPALVQFVLSLPADLIVNRNAVTKAVFRQSMRGLVPDPILDRKDKIGFSTPEQSWLQALKPWIDGTLHSASQAQVGSLNLDEVTQEWARVTSGRAAFDWRIWRWINFLRWRELYKVEC